MPYKIEVEHDEDPRYYRSLEDELAWAISRHYGRGVQSMTIKLIRFEVKNRAHQVRVDYEERAPRWLPTTMANLPIRNWPDGDALCVCVANAAIRAKGELKEYFDEHFERVVSLKPSDDRTFVDIRIAFPCEASTPVESIVRRSG